MKKSFHVYVICGIIGSMTKAAPSASVVGNLCQYNILLEVITKWQNGYTYLRKEELT
jgi:hypothetical protein